MMWHPNLHLVSTSTVAGGGAVVEEAKHSVLVAGLVTEKAFLANGRVKALTTTAREIMTTRVVVAAAFEEGKGDMMMLHYHLSRAKKTITNTLLEIT